MTDRQTMTEWIRAIGALACWAVTALIAVSYLTAGHQLVSLLVFFFWLVMATWTTYIALRFTR
jgi:hypothetical protein